MPPRLSSAVRSRSWRGAWVWGAALGLVVAIGILHYLPPERHGFYPKCGLYLSTGLLCPACGGLRAVHHLTRAHWLEALRSNALVVVGAPVVLAWIAFRRFAGGVMGTGAAIPAWFWWVAGSIVLAFGVLRNLPFSPFNWLAPLSG